MSIPTKHVSAISCIAYDNPRAQWEIFQKTQAFEEVVALKPTLTSYQKKRLEHFNYEVYLKSLQDKHIVPLVYGDVGYPDLLNEIDFPPVILYTKGQLSLLKKPGLGVVGARKATPYGLETTATLTRQLAPYFTIISGMAMGVDAAAHQAALETGGHTIAVLGNGVEKIYPRQHADLYHKLLDGNLVVSEFPPGVSSLPHHFPQRNRIISGLSRGVLVIEAGEKSGALISARLAMESNRDVFAVPGQIDTPQSMGTHRLIQDGAKLVMSAKDITDELVQFVSKGQVLAKLPLNIKQAVRPQPTMPNDLTELEKKVWEGLGENGIQFDTLQQQLAVPSTELLKTLTMMELKQVLVQKPGKLFFRSDKC